MIEIKIKIEGEEANTKLETVNLSVSDLSVALAQLEITKMNLIGKIMKITKMQNQNI